MIHSHVGDKKREPSTLKEESAQSEWKEGPDKVVEKSKGTCEDVDVEVKKNFYDPELSKVPSSQKPKVEAKHGIERVVDHVKESMHGSSEKS